jgi:hypothetical protein
MKAMSLSFWGNATSPLTKHQKDAERDKKESNRDQDDLQRSEADPKRWR